MSPCSDSRFFLPGCRLGRVLVILMAAGMSAVFAQNNQFGNIHGVVSDSSARRCPV
jgi:hypothetical protein